MIFAGPLRSRDIFPIIETAFPKLSQLSTPARYFELNSVFLIRILLNVTTVVSADVYVCIYSRTHIIYALSKFATMGIKLLSQGVEFFCHISSYEQLCAEAFMICICAFDFSRFALAPNWPIAP